MRNNLIPIVSFFLLISSCSTPQVAPTKVVLSSVVLNPSADGISVVKVEVQPNHVDVQNVLQQFGEQIMPDLHERLLQEGIHIRKINAVDVPALITSIGTIVDESYVWHGQIFTWRDLHQRHINPQGMLISQQGTPYFISKGYLSILGRSWLLDRENGLHIYLQFLPTWHVPREQSSLVATSSSPIQSKIFSELELEVLLKDDEAIIIVVELTAPVMSSGPQDGGPPPVRLGEALLGGPVHADIVQILVIEANILTRG